MGNIKGLQDPLPQPDHAEGLRRAVGPEPVHGDELRRRLEDLASSRRSSPTPTGMTVAQRGMRGLRAPRPRRRADQPLRPRRAARAGRHRRLRGRRAARTRASSASPSTRDPKQRHYLNLYKLGEGPLYSFYTPYHLCHFEVPQHRGARACCSATPPASRSAGRGSRCAPCAKRDLKAGEVLDDYGHYMTYGEAVNSDEMRRERLPAGGAGRGLPPQARHRQGRR